MLILIKSFGIIKVIPAIVSWYTPAKQIGGFIFMAKQANQSTDNNQFSEECQASIKRLEALREKLKTIPTTDRPLTPEEQEWVDKANKKLQEIRDLRNSTQPRHPRTTQELGQACREGMARCQALIDRLKG